jgi:outer membrane protein TolC
MKPISTGRAVPPLLALVTLSACMVGPDYRRPSAPTPAAFKEVAGWTAAQPSDAADRRDWWTVFGDPVLDGLETRVEISNQTLAAAEAGYRQARALVAQQRAALFPAITLGAAAAGAGGGGGKPTTQAYSLNLGGTWEPDLWGRVRRTIENAQANAGASAADLANARLSAQTELAVDYVQLRQLDEEKRILDATTEAYRRTASITQNKYAAGVSARSDVLAAQSQLQSTQADDADLEQQRARLERHPGRRAAGGPDAGARGVDAEPAGDTAGPAQHAAATSPRYRGGRARRRRRQRPDRRPDRRLLSQCDPDRAGRRFRTRSRLAIQRRLDRLVAGRLGGRDDLRRGGAKGVGPGRARRL